MAPKCRPMVQTSTTLPSQKAGSDPRPQTSSLYPAAVVWITVWTKDTRLRKQLLNHSPTFSSMEEKYFSTMPIFLQSSMVTEQPVTPFHLKWSRTSTSVSQRVALLASTSEPSSYLILKGSALKLPSATLIGPASMDVFRSSMPKASIFGKSETDFRMPRPWNFVCEVSAAAATAASRATLLGLDAELEAGVGCEPPASCPKAQSTCFAMRARCFLDVRRRRTT
mmetsp:Transcript_21633/g.50548  ORF Transcript_21633/g.50548 Transcript_21633/m.50548 type:complete len:224 (-) Transcript_21633:278-949(-)